VKEVGGRGEIEGEESVCGEKSGDIPHNIMNYLHKHSSQLGFRFAPFFMAKGQARSPKGPRHKDATSLGVWKLLASC